LIVKRVAYFAIGGTVLVAFLTSAIVGELMGQGVLHPMLRPLTSDSIQTSEAALHKSGANLEDILVTAPDGVLLRGWKVSPSKPNSDWVILFHGVSDNRTGMTGQAVILLRHGYSVVMMDARAHGDSGGSMATYGWLERKDTHEIVNALYASDAPKHLFALGSSMGAAIALQSAGIEPRIAGVVAESSFSNLREVTYDYAGLHWSPWLGKTLFIPGTWAVISKAREEGGFSPDDVSPEKAVASRPFPVLLICDQADRIIPCRHTRKIFAAATGPKELWEVPGAGHASALGADPAQYERRVIGFFQNVAEGTIAVKTKY
jgi:uncharacterized protein